MVVEILPELEQLLNDDESIKDLLCKRTAAEIMVCGMNDQLCKIAQAYVLSVLEISRDDDRHIWPGMNSKEITKRINKLYSLNFTADDIGRALEELEEKDTISCDGVPENKGYWVKITGKHYPIMPFKGSK